MRVLEVRFHPLTKSAPRAVVVARVRFAAEAVQIEPVALAEPAPPRLDAEAVLAKLRFLVESCGPSPFDRLRKLQSDYWSFIEIG